MSISWRSPCPKTKNSSLIVLGWDKKDKESLKETIENVDGLYKVWL